MDYKRTIDATRESDAQQFAVNIDIFTTGLVTKAVVLDFAVYLRIDTIMTLLFQFSVITC